MTTVTVKDKIGLGQFIIAAAQNDQLRAVLTDREKDRATPVLREFVDVPEGHRIEVHAATEAVTPMMLPTPEQIKQSLDAVTARGIAYSAEYTPGDPAYIDPATDARRALEFLIGDYILKNCR
jgi:hypothetical protein